MILLLDCRDSFVETLARYAREAGAETRVVRADAITLDEARALRPEGVILSPGPKRPADAGIALPLIAALPDTPILGVCLGHQAIAEAYGGRTVVSSEPVHGRASLVRHEGDPLFAGVPSPFAAARYHSLIGVAGPALREVAWTQDGLPMAFRHESRPHVGVQFHPESLLTEGGHCMIENFVATTRGPA
ncbi:anthranilate synthase component II [Parvularcula dongshanensis]|uniref:Anthranilate synthase/aminodeoxychorismate synthase-like glutamine amidotransferase n=1 Tax=Parvularcula dongshanensis TaxID=1173995 RepID=A0A840HY19_9PROT|nr:aminodeoxychorismate/anthranilate synthase component II [Parvularcula dongshanensis]MBB4657746.1 anthranilate synthase/aminodeoxychorismate synthase-like glutamine amidotransferase [Parvularcula dongshanensis]